jgi:hypothetical protein
MKTILLILAIFTFSLASAQIQITNTTSQKIGEIRKLGFPVATLTQITETDYSLRYRDMQNWDADKYYDIPFQATPEELQQLNKIMASVHEPANAKNKSYALQLTLGTTPITVRNYTYMGIVMTEVVTPDGYFQLTKSQVQKLFGK